MIRRVSPFNRDWEDLLMEQCGSERRRQFWAGDPPATFACFTLFNILMGDPAMKAKQIISIVAVAALLMGTGFVRADTLLSINFEGPTYTTGDIVGQGGWTQTVYGPTTYFDPYVGTGIGVNTSQVFVSNPSLGTITSGYKTSAADYKLTTPLVFTAADTAIELRFKVCAEYGGANYMQGNLGINMRWWDEGDTNNYKYPTAGVYYQFGTSTQPKTSFRPSGSSATYFGDTLDAGHWYEMKLVMDFSKSCASAGKYGKLTYFYRDLTDGEDEDDFHTDATLQNYDMSLVPNESGEFLSHGIYAYIQTGYTDPAYTQHTYLDDIRVIDPVPEPSTIALLAAGLVGLLTYAWRKRK